jgi:hypothetical protein
MCEALTVFSLLFVICTQMPARYEKMEFNIRVRHRVAFGSYNKVGRGSWSYYDNKAARRVEKCNVATSKIGTISLHLDREIKIASRTRH